MEHLFTEKERQFFATQRQQIQQLQTAYNNALQLILVQNDLAGAVEAEGGWKRI